MILKLKRTIFLNQIIQEISSKKYSNSFVPLKPTWDLIPPKRTKKVNEIDIKKLEKLSMLSIDSQIEKDLNDAVNVVERMCNAPVTKDTKSLIYYAHLGTCKLREDDEKLCSSEALKESAEMWRNRILRNATYKYEDYFVAPPTKANSNE